MTDSERLALVVRVASVLSGHPSVDQAVLEALRDTRNPALRARGMSAATDLVSVVLSMLADAGLLERQGSDPLEHTSDRTYFVRDGALAQRILEDVWLTARVPVKPTGAEMCLLRTWPFPHPLPGSIARETADLDLFLIRLVSEARANILIVSPFFNMAAAVRLLQPLLQAHKRGVCIELITYQAHRDGPSRSAALHLQDSLADSADTARHRGLIVYSEISDSPMIHAKLLLVDAARGYLGSANLTRQGFSEHLEVGVSLTEPQVQAADRLFRYVIQQELVTRVLA